MSAAAGSSRPTAAGTGTPDPSQTNIPNSTSNSGASTNSESNFPQAAVIAISVIGGLVALFALYQFYRWIHKRSQHLRSSYRAPPSPTMQSPNVGGMQQTGGFGAAATAAGTGAGGRGKFSRMSSFQSMGSFGPPMYPSLGASSTRSSTFMLDAQGQQIQQDGALSPGISDGFITNPTSPFLNNSVQHPYPSRAAVRGNSSMSTDVLRAQGSRSSLLHPNNTSSPQAQQHRDRRSTLPNSYSQFSTTSAGSSNGNLNGSTSSLLSPFAGSSAGTPRRPRVSGPPHARHSRVEIVPPTPLAPPPGTVVATDKTTLAFSALSGIGTQGSVMGLSGFTGNIPPGSATASSSSGPGSAVDDASSVGGSRWFNTPLAGSEIDLAGRGNSASGGSSGPASSSGASDIRKPGSSANSSNEDHSSRPQSPVLQQQGSRLPQSHARAFSNATTVSSAHFSDESSMSTGPVPPLPSSPTSLNKANSPPGPQSPLDKLKLELQGEARRVERRSASSASSGDVDVKGKGKERQASTGVLSLRDVEAYRRGESGPVLREP